MKKISALKKELRKDWYIQGFNSYPAFLNSAARSGFVMKKELGFGYTEFIFNYKDGFGEMWYLVSDFSRIWKIIKLKLKQNPKYLRQVKKRYEEIFEKNEKLFSKIGNSQLSKLSDEELIEMLKGCSLSTMDGVGIAHLLDPIGLEIEKEFKAELAGEISDENQLNKIYPILTMPEKLSFVAQEEEDLRKIAKSPLSGRREKLEAHAKKYFWVQNSFAGGKRLGLPFFEKRMHGFGKKYRRKSAAAAKQGLMKKHKFGRTIREMVGLINFCVMWQDKRKANVLKSIGYFSEVVEEAGRRARVDKKLLNYLGFNDILGAKSISEFGKMKRELAARKNGVFVRMGHGSEQFFFGRNYSLLVKYRHKLLNKEKKESNELHGSIASRGTAIGKVVVCLGIRSFDKVKKGDVVVASMTRPEYMPALKKAAAIVTDEGGITSHAAIIARELGIPAVIGTKVATKVLKDGDFIEVKANHGVVRILKRK